MRDQTTQPPTTQKDNTTTHYNIYIKVTRRRKIFDNILRTRQTERESMTNNTTMLPRETNLRDKTT